MSVRIPSFRVFFRAEVSSKVIVGMQPEGESFSNILGAFSNASPQRPCDKRDAPPRVDLHFQRGQPSGQNDKMISIEL